METHRHVKALNKLLREKLPQGVSETKRRVGDGSLEVVLRWETSEEVTTKITLDLSNEMILVNSTSAQMLVFDFNLNDLLVTYIALVQEVLPFGCLEFKWDTGEASFRTTQSLLGISSVDELFTFHVYAHFRMFPKVSKSFGEAQKRAKVSQSSLEELVEKLSEEFEESNDLVQLLP